MNLQDSFRRFKRWNRQDIFFIALMILLAGGWIANLVKLISVATDQGVTAMFVLRLIGLVAWPIGIILGFV
jgi:hypothetical protein